MMHLTVLASAFWLYPGNFHRIDYVTVRSHSGTGSIRLIKTPFYWNDKKPFQSAGKKLGTSILHTDLVHSTHCQCIAGYTLCPHHAIDINIDNSGETMATGRAANKILTSVVGQMDSQVEPFKPHRSTYEYMIVDVLYFDIIHYINVHVYDGSYIYIYTFHIILDI